VRQRAEPYGAGCAAFSPDGSRFAWAENNLLCLGDARGKRDDSAPRMAHEKEILAMTFSPDGKRILTGSRDRTARLWDPATGEFQSFAHDDDVNAVAFAADGKWFLTGSSDKLARHWDVATGTLLARPLRHSNPVRGVAISADGQTLATGTLQGSVQLWELPRAVIGDAARAVLWAQFKSGMELAGDESIRVLDDATRAARTEQLLKLGGPPLQ
jgi:WD40 repeat protein